MSLLPSPRSDLRQPYNKLKKVAATIERRDHHAWLSSFCDFCKIDIPVPVVTLTNALMPATKPEPSELIPTRNSLITRLKDWEDQAGWKEFFDTYWKLIYGVARQAGLTDSEAQEVVQETVISVAKSMKNFTTGSEHGSFKAWLLKNTRWRIVDQFRKRAPEEQHGIHRRPEDTDRTGTVDRIPDPNGLALEAVWDQEWEKNLMGRALERVKAKVNLKHYQVFYLNVVKEMPASQVAKSLGVSMSLVYVAKLRVSRLVKKTYEELKEKSI